MPPTVDADGLKERRLDEMNTLAEVAAFAKVSKATLHRAIAKGELEAVRVHGRSIRLAESAVRAWLSGAGYSEGGSR